MTNSLIQIRELREKISISLENSFEDGRIDADRFFENWFFKEGGRSFLFLFEKNLKVTNLQFGELLALLRVLNNPINGYPAPTLQFVSRSEFCSAIMAVTSCFSDLDPSKKKWDFVASHYAELLYRMIVIEAFHGCCTVHFPFHLELQLLKLVHRAGYVHSCGRLVYSRVLDSARTSDFLEAVTDHLKKFPPSQGNKLLFAVYAHEDFSKFDRNHKANLRHGLDSVKVLVDRFYMGGDRLVGVIEQLKSKLGDQIEVPDPSSFNSSQRRFSKSRRAERTRSLWLVVDRRVDESSGKAGGERCYLCYEQLYVAEGAFRIFDEDKPAWVAPVTIPHALASAMINISAPYWPPEGEIKMCDPFVGSGTVWFESYKWGCLSSLGSDLNLMARQLARDNVDFARISFDVVRKLIKVLEEGLDPKVFLPVDLGGAQVTSEFWNAFTFATEFFKETAVPGHVGVSLNDERLSRLSKASRLQRALYYTCLRAQFRNISAFERNKKDWWTAFSFELRELIERLRTLKHFRRRTSSSFSEGEEISVFQGRYSKAVTMSAERLKTMARDIESRISTRDATNLPVKAFDLIVTDPPYGFNTDENTTEMATLYRRFFRVAVRALRDGGQLVVALPEQSFIGRASPPFTHKEVVIQQVLCAADREGRHAILDATAVPQPGFLFRAPYYWEAEKTLRRSILHFRFGPPVGLQRGQAAN